MNLQLSYCCDLCCGTMVFILPLTNHWQQLWLCVHAGLPNCSSPIYHYAVNDFPDTRALHITLLPMCGEKFSLVNMCSACDLRHCGTFKLLNPWDINAWGRWVVLVWEASENNLTEVHCRALVINPRLWQFCKAQSRAHMCQCWWTTNLNGPLLSDCLNCVKKLKINK